MNFILTLLGLLFSKKQPVVEPKTVEISQLQTQMPEDLDMSTYVMLRNDLLRCYLKFNTEIIKAKGAQKDYIASYWSGTTIGITQVLNGVFKQKDDADIEESLRLFDEEIRKSIDTLPVTDGSGSDGGFMNYSGPKGTS